MSSNFCYSTVLNKTISTHLNILLGFGFLLKVENKVLKVLRLARLTIFLTLTIAT